MSSRCECVIYWHGGTIERCQSHKAKGLDFCTHHNKYFTLEDYFPAPQDWKYNDWTEENGEYVEKVTNLDHSRVREFDYTTRKTASIYNGL